MLERSSEVNWVKHHEDAPSPLDLQFTLPHLLLCPLNFCGAWLGAEGLCEEAVGRGHESWSQDLAQDVQRLRNWYDWVGSLRERVASVPG